MAKRYRDEFRRDAVRMATTSGVTVFDAPMFVKEWLLRRWAHKVRDRFRGRYSVSSTE
jgi:transposase-like protein